MVLLTFLQKLNIYYALTIGLMPMNDFAVYQVDAILAEYLSAPSVSYYADYQAEISTPKDIFFIGGGIKCVFQPKAKSHTMIPLRQAYNFNAGFRYDRFEIGFNHYCTHPLAFYINNKANSYSIHGAYEEIYIKVESRF